MDNNDRSVNTHQICVWQRAFSTEQKLCTSHLDVAQESVPLSFETTLSDRNAFTQRVVYLSVNNDSREMQVDFEVPNSSLMAQFRPRAIPHSHFVRDGKLTLEGKFSDGFKTFPQQYPTEYHIYIRLMMIQ